MLDNSDNHSHRREVFAGVRATASVPIASPGWSALPKIRQKPAGLIDVHHHILPPGAPEALLHHLAGWSASGAVAEMDRTGVATGIAYPGPIRSGDVQERRGKARLWNEFASELGQEHPGRFGLFASLPFPHVDSCIAEIDHALDHLKADGFGITTSYGELWLGDESLWPIYEELNSRQAVVFVHPHDAACCGADRLSYQQAMMDGSWIEWPMNTARTILSLMASGTLRKFSQIRFIFSHGGGLMPLLIERLAGLAAWKAVGPEVLQSLFPHGIRGEFQTLHFECAQACSHTNMAALRSLVPDSQILFGSDYPFFSLAYATEQFARLALQPKAERAIARSNAAALLPRWA